MVANANSLFPCEFCPLYGILILLSLPLTSIVVGVLFCSVSPRMAGKLSRGIALFSSFHLVFILFSSCLFSSEEKSRESMDIS